MLKNVTFSADEILLQRARELAKKEGKSLNTVFREWLKSYAAQESTAGNYRNLMDSLTYATPGRKFSREEMNAR